MTKRIASKHKVDRRLKVNLWGRPKSPFNSRNYPPGQHGKSKRGKPSDYGTQLQAKQKMKFYYGNINERQFRNIYRKAMQKKGNTTENLVGFLEVRLDTVTYRAKFASTVFSARQLINHGHIKVNGKKITFTHGDKTITTKLVGDYVSITGGGEDKRYLVDLDFEFAGSFYGKITFGLDNREDFNTDILLNRKTMRMLNVMAVSYTHLTLPTSDLV